MSADSSSASREGERPKTKRRWLRGAGITLTVAIVGCVVTGLVVHEDRPTGESGAEADALARRLTAAVNGGAWERTGAVRWTFREANEHLWDRERGYARVRWDDFEVLLRTGDQTGVALEGGRVVDGSAADELLEKAYERWINDSFWLNPVVKLFDDGVTRSLVSTEEGEALLIEYASGGVTPGDAYLWLPGDDGLPQAWKMWVSIIPIGGVRASWEGWQTLETGARVATRHEIGPFTLELTAVAGDETLRALLDRDGVRDDPFARLER